MLAVLYAAVLSLYYMDTLWASIAGLVFAVVSGYWLNRHELGRIKTLVVNKMRKQKEFIE